MWDDPCIPSVQQGHPCKDHLPGAPLGSLGLKESGLSAEVRGQMPCIWNLLVFAQGKPKDLFSFTGMSLAESQQRQVKVACSLGRQPATLSLPPVECPFCRASPLSPCFLSPSPPFMLVTAASSSARNTTWLHLAAQGRDVPAPAFGVSVTAPVTARLVPSPRLSQGGLAVWLDPGAVSVCAYRPL